MRKEVLFAILAGTFFGLIIAFGIWRLNSTLSPGNNTSTEASPTPQPPEEFGITIAKPEENQVLTDSPGTITGITKPRSFVIASSNDEDFITQAGDDGEFAIEVDLVGGVNQILLASIDESGKMATTQISIAHSTELSIEEGEESQEESTESSDVVRDRVQEKVSEAQNIPLYYMGTVTDIVEEAVQIRSDSGEIKQVSVEGQDASYVSLVNDTEQIEFSDVAIGDFIVAMGFVDSNEVLSAQRILVTTPPSEITRQIVFGQITNIGGGQITLNTPDDEVALDFPTAWKGPDLDELEEGQELIAVGEESGGVFDIRSIFTTEVSEEE